MDFFSIAAKYTMTSPRECVAVPCCSEAILAWLRPERVGDPRWPDAFANGAFIMVRRAPFEAIGGWGSVRSKISEDLELARVAQLLRAAAGRRWETASTRPRPTARRGNRGMAGAASSTGL